MFAIVDFRDKIHVTSRSEDIIRQVYDGYKEKGLCCRYKIVRIPI